MMLLLPLVGTVLVGAAPAPATPSLEPDKVRDSVKRGLVFLEKEGVQWKEVKKCASCHHVPMMVWAMNDAKNKGFAVNDKVLAEITAWMTAADNKAKVF